MRKIARVVEIDDVLPHNNADKLEIAIVGGWRVVVKKGLYETGDKAIFVEVDGFVPETIAPFLTKGEPQEYNNVVGNRLRTVRLRGELSQGLILPLTTRGKDDLVTGTLFDVGDDVTEFLGIQKWEAPISARLAGSVRGNFPSWIQKTDQERVQNLTHELEQYKELKWRIQEKLEGSSMTVWIRDGESGVCSRNLDLKRDENNTFWKTALKLDILSKMEKYFSENDSVAIQGELIGPGIQKNIYNLQDHEFHVFDIQMNGQYLDEIDVACVCYELGLRMVPKLGYVEFNTVQDCLNIAEGPSLLNTDIEREGVVFRCVSDPNLTFKAISNRYLLSEQ